MYLFMFFNFRHSNTHDISLHDICDNLKKIRKFLMVVEILNGAILQKKKQDNIFSIQFRSN